MLVVIGTDSTGSCKFNYHMIMTMTAPLKRYCNNNGIYMMFIIIYSSEYKSVSIPGVHA